MASIRLAAGWLVRSHRVGRHSPEAAPEPDDIAEPPRTTRSADGDPLHRDHAPSRPRLTCSKLAQIFERALHFTPGPIEQRALVTGPSSHPTPHASSSSRRLPMASFLVPQAQHPEHTASVTQQQHAGEHDSSQLGRDSHSGHQISAEHENPTTIVGASAPQHPMDLPPKEVAPSDDKSADPDDKSKTGEVEMAAAGGAGAAAATGKRQILMKRVNEPRYVTDEKGWSTGRKICCALMLLLLAAIITVAVLIAFLVRTPTVDYVSATPYCAAGTSLQNYYDCVRTYVQVKVLLTVNNPNIIGATVNADLGLFKEDGTFLGPGTIEDTDVGARGSTEVTANFNITSDRGYDILVALYLPPNRDVNVHVEGSVYIHVGLLRPSISISQDFTIPAQNLGTAVGGLIGPGATETIGSVIGTGGDVIDTAGGVAGTVGDVAGTVGDVTGDPGNVAGSIGGVAGTVDDALGGAGGIADGLAGAIGRNGRNAKSINPRHFAHALTFVGAPQSSQREEYDMQLIKDNRFHTMKITKMKILSVTAI